MKMKGIVSLLSAGCMALTSFVPVHAGAEQSLKFDVPVIASSGGNTTVTLTAKSVQAAADVYLVAAYMDKTTGNILSISAASGNMDAAGDSLTATVTDKSSSNGELCYYVWDGLKNRIPLLNSAPAAPGAAECTASSAGSTAISWSAALDEWKNAEKYNIYDSGMLVAGELEGLSATVSNLRYNSDYNLEIRAIDDEGAESASGTFITASTAGIPEAITKGESTDAVTTDDLQFVLVSGENYNATRSVSAENAGGLACRETMLTAGGRATFLNYRYSPAYLSKISDVRDFVMELTYFDEGTEQIKVNLYADSAGGSSAGTYYLSSYATLPKKTDSKTWKTARIKFTMPCKFVENTNSGNAYYNFRVQDNDGQGGMKVYRLAVVPQSEYNPVDAYFAAEEANFTCGMDAVNASLTAQTEKEGKKAISASSFAFTVTDGNICSAANASIELCYYADTPAALMLDGTEAATLTPGKWQKVRINASSLGEGEHILSTADNSNVYINSVRILPQ